MIKDHNQCAVTERALSKFYKSRDSIHKEIKLLEISRAGIESQIETLEDELRVWHLNNG